ncbi:hypothetical protein BCV69DRAFT_301953 [Microstroma glucosiphilum]|uniref:Uncharacterized protein n=1 Tax=Pseudomicrostroma glucosiphilum TaxID=1684307 RepID=A0A316TVW7_9BASI|nr:hypothetical protein BCV69DRAFT_301953 [Pseudomicrostroma glucosiphilum]PWN17676.1 hypothetical protein BCV69DRAFT_301953 [Pseudomicrostroma glucosiphilum]
MATFGDPLGTQRKLQVLDADGAPIQPQSTRAGPDSSQEDFTENNHRGDSEAERDTDAGCEADSGEQDIQSPTFSSGRRIQGHIEEQDVHSSASQSNTPFINEDLSCHRLRVILQQPSAGLLLALATVLTIAGKSQDRPQVHSAAGDGKLLRSIDPQSPVFQVVCGTASTYLKGDLSTHDRTDRKDQIPGLVSLDKRELKLGRKVFPGQLVHTTLPKDKSPVYLSLKGIPSVRLREKHAAFQSALQANSCSLQTLEFSAREQGNPLLVFADEDGIGHGYWSCTFVRNAIEPLIITGRAIQPQEIDLAQMLRAINTDSLADSVVILRGADCPWEQNELACAPYWLEASAADLYTQSLNSIVEPLCTVHATSPDPVAETELTQSLSHHQALLAALTNSTRPSTLMSTVKTRKRQAPTPLALVCTKRSRHGRDSTPARNATAKTDAAVRLIQVQDYAADTARAPSGLGDVVSTTDTSWGRPPPSRSIPGSKNAQAFPATAIPPTGSATVFS